MMMPSTDQLIEHGDWNRQVVLINTSGQDNCYPPSHFDDSAYMIIKTSRDDFNIDYAKYAEYIGSRLRNDTGLWSVYKIPSKKYRVAVALQYTTTNITHITSKF